MVRAKGLEPPHLAMPEPKSGASTNFATPANPHPRSIPAQNHGVPSVGRLYNNDGPKGKGEAPMIANQRVKSVSVCPRCRNNCRSRRNCMRIPGQRAPSNSEIIQTR